MILIPREATGFRKPAADTPMAQLNAYDESSDTTVEALIDSYAQRFYAESHNKPSRIRHNIWTITEDRYIFNIIITSLLCIFDAILLDGLPERKQDFYEELLMMNAHQVKSSKLCLVKDKIHLRIIRGLEDFDYSEFVDHVNEFRQLHPSLKEKLIDTYYPKKK